MHNQEKNINVMLWAVVVVLLGVMLESNKVDATVWNVGDHGWTFDVQGWESGKNFMAGDTLVFNYKVGDHSVTIVNESNYKECIVPEDAIIYSSGHDEFVLNKGITYFTCGILGHCTAGMHIAPNAA
ncbi:hypothetical protein ABFS83_02G066100 [Erythranthe nasuta]